MKLTCLSRGNGLYFPPCHILDLSGLRILLDCPLDLSALAVFSPNLHRPSPRLEPALIRAVPRYKAVEGLSDWDPSLFDLVLISGPMGMLGLPFLIRNRRFSAKIYATEAAARLGRLAMEELVSMHSEYVGYYGPEEDPGVPEWMRTEEVRRLPEELREIVMGLDGEIGAWFPLYSTEDLKECWKKVSCVKYGENCVYNGSLILKPFSSGAEIGTCNWTICCHGRSIAYLSSVIFKSSHAASFNYEDIQGMDFVIYSDISSLQEADDSFTGSMLPGESCSNSAELIDKSISTEYSDEHEKMDFICSCIVDSVKEGGSVLIPIGRPGIMLELIEQITLALELSGLKVPIYMISSSMEETLAFANAIHEWLPKERQEKIYTGDPLFGHSKLIEEKRLHVFHALHSSSLISMWSEPCVVFSPHWSLRLGPSIHLLHRWSGQKSSLLVMEEGVNTDIALSPFKPLKLKVLQCSFLPGIKLHKVLQLVKLLHPKLVLFPEIYRGWIPLAENTSSSLMFYAQGSTLSIPSPREDIEAFLSTDLIFKLQPKKLPEENVAIARLQGRLFSRDGKFVVLPSQKSPTASNNRVYWDHVDPGRLLSSLREKGMSASLHKHDNSNLEADYFIHIKGSKSAVMQLRGRETIIAAADEALAAEIYEAFCSASNGI